MSWQLIFYWSKKIHRIAMWGVMVLGFGMTSGGLILHRELGGEWIPPMMDTMLIRYWHNKMATSFAFFLIVMIVTGLLMWVVPKILSARNNRSL